MRPFDEQVPELLMTKEIYKDRFCLFLAYVACWLLAYAAINQDFNLALVFEYLVQAWSFGGLVRPMYIWWLSNAIFIVVAVLYLAIKRRRPREQ